MTFRNNAIFLCLAFIMLGCVGDDSVLPSVSITDGDINPASAPVPETGQTTCYDALGNTIACLDSGQDGELQKGVAWPSPRFTDYGDGTVRDNLTGLTWMKEADCIGILLLIMMVTPAMAWCTGKAPLISWPQ